MHGCQVVSKPTKMIDSVILHDCINDHKYYNLCISEYNRLAVSSGICPNRECFWSALWQVVILLRCYLACGHTYARDQTAQDKQAF